MALSVLIGILIYKIYGHYFGGVVFSSSFAVTLVGMTVLSCMLTLVVIHFFYNRRKKGVIYILVAHYGTGLSGDEIIRAVKKMKYQMKSKTIRGNLTELTLELLCKNPSTVFLEQIKAIDGVQDVTLIQYNGEYHG